MNKINRYEILQELGRGGMATVFLAHDPAFDRQVAVKVLPPQFLHDPQFRARFQREAKVIAALEHAYIVPVYDFGEENGQPYLVMRYMPSGTLAARMKAGPLARREIAEIVRRLAEALDEAHSRGIVHRDLKPANVLFDGRGQAFLTDFGIAKMLEGTTVLTGSAVVGTPAYMSPEQAVGDKGVDGRSDVYSLGVMVYEMLTGHAPYQADTPVRLLLKHVTEPVPQIDHAEAARLGLPDTLNGVLAQALAKEPEGRYATASQLAEPLSRFASGEDLAHGAPAERTLLATMPSQFQAGRAARAQQTTVTETVAKGLSGRLLLGLGGLGGIGLLVALGVWLGVNWSGGVTATLTPTLLPVVATAAPPTLTPAPSATATIAPPTPPPSATVTVTATVTPSATLTPTRRPRTPLVLTATPLPQCLEGEYFDPVMNLCRRPNEPAPIVTEEAPLPPPTETPTSYP